MTPRLITGIACVALLLPRAALAHSVVSPAQTSTSKYENFSLSVPTEKDVPTVGMRLEVSTELDYVTPVVKPGWAIKVTKDAAGKVTQIAWTGGSIPAGQKDFFQFSARTPATSTTLVWKAYQTYRDGTVVAWDRDPSKPEPGKEKAENPYSMTEVKSDAPVQKQSFDNATPTISFLSFVLSVVALAIALQNRKHEH